MIPCVDCAFSYVLYLRAMTGWHQTSGRGSLWYRRAVGSHQQKHWPGTEAPPEASAGSERHNGAQEWSTDSGCTQQQWRADAPCGWATRPVCREPGGQLTDRGHEASSFPGSPPELQPPDSQHRSTDHGFSQCETAQILHAWKQDQPVCMPGSLLSHSVCLEAGSAIWFLLHFWKLGNPLCMSSAGPQVDLPAGAGISSA